MLTETPQSTNCENVLNYKPVFVFNRNSVNAGIRVKAIKEITISITISCRLTAQFKGGAKKRQNVTRSSEATVANTRNFIRQFLIFFRDHK